MSAYLIKLSNEIEKAFPKFSERTLGISCAVGIYVSRNAQLPSSAVNTAKKPEYSTF